MSGIDSINGAGGGSKGMDLWAQYIQQNDGPDNAGPISGSSAEEEKLLQPVPSPFNGGPNTDPFRDAPPNDPPIRLDYPEDARNVG